MLVNISSSLVSWVGVCMCVRGREKGNVHFFTFPKWHVHHSKATCGLSQQQQQQQQNVTKTKTKLQHHHQREQSQSASLSLHKDPVRRQKEWKCMLWIRSAYRQSLPSWKKSLIQSSLKFSRDTLVNILGPHKLFLDLLIKSSSDKLIRKDTLFVFWLSRDSRNQ